MTGPFLGLAPDVVPTRTERFAYTARHRPLVYAAGLGAAGAPVGVVLMPLSGLPVTDALLVVVGLSGFMFLLGLLGHREAHPPHSTMNVVTPRDHAAVLRTIRAVRHDRQAELHPRLRDVALAEIDRRRTRRWNAVVLLILAVLQLLNCLLQWDDNPTWAITLFLIAAGTACAGAWEWVAQRRMARASTLIVSTAVDRPGGLDDQP